MSIEMNENNNTHKKLIILKWKLRSWSWKWTYLSQLSQTIDFIDEYMAIW